MMELKGKITFFKRVDTDEVPSTTAPIAVVDGKLERPETLRGTTYKLSTPLCPHALYVTINDIVFNEGTPQEVVRPFEIFINTKDTESLQWVTAVTRLASAIFRKGGDVSFIIEELCSIHSPGGSYMRKGGKFIPSLVAEVGLVIERHLGLQQAQTQAKIEHVDMSTATLCPKCHSKGVIRINNCPTCIHCGDSKCG